MLPGWQPFRRHAEYRALLLSGDGAGRRCAREAPSGLDQWLELVTRGLNGMWSGRACVSASLADAPETAPSPQQVVAFWHLERKVEAFLLTPGLQVSETPAEELFARKDVSYGGDLVARAHALTWAQVEPSLPPKERCGSIDVLALCDERMRMYLGAPLGALVDLDGLDRRPRPGRVHAKPGEAVLIGRGLLSRGLVRPLRKRDLLHVRGEPLLNGMFGVTKDSALPDGRPVLRLIMNLTASNSVMADFPGDIGALPYYGQWRSIVLEGGCELEWSYDDLKGAFYLLRLPAAWAPLFAFDFEFSAAELGLADWGEESVYLGATTMPMRWKNAMGIVQYIHRRLHVAEGACAQGLPRGREVRKDRCFPALSEPGGPLDEFWQLYCDDAGYARVVAASRRLEADAEAQQGLAEAARARYRESGVPLSEKRGTRERSVCRLGAFVDGVDGRLRIPAKRLGLLARLSVSCLERDNVGRKQFEILLGHWVHAGSFRRELMSVFVKSWQVLQQWPPGKRGRLRDPARGEVLLGLALLP